MNPRQAFAALLLALTWLLTPGAAHAQRYDPGWRFRSLPTPHFTVHFHQGEEADAARLATIAEETRQALQALFGLEAPRHTHVILVDQTDRANGWSTPLPYNVIELTRTAPPPHALIGQYDDWLRLVFVHEYMHTMHLDQVGGVMRVVRYTLGRHPLSFPNLFLPAWQIEGLPTFAESTSGQGRVHGADVRAALREQWRQGTAPTLDQLSSGLVAWPGGWARYLYGGVAMDDLARRAGTPALGAYVRATARRPPYLGQGAFEKVFGESPQQTWARLGTAETAAAAVTTAAQPSVQLTKAGYLVTAPRFVHGPRGSEAQPGVVYSVSSPHDFPSIRSVRLDASGDAHVASRFVGDAIAVWQDWLIVDQLEFDGAVKLHADLWAVAAGRRSVRLSHGDRLSEPDVSRDGSTLAAVQALDGRRVLALRAVLSGDAGRPRLAASPHVANTPAGCSVATPRWAPDGGRLAAVLHCADRLPQIALYRLADRSWTPIAPRSGARDITPAWTPDGRWVVFASDRAGGAPALFAAFADTPAANAVSILAPAGGASWPDISPDGLLLAYVGATATGVEAFAAPMPSLPDAAPAGSGDPGRGIPDAAAANQRAEAVTGADRPYSPWSSLLPRYWDPWLAANDGQTEFGAFVTGSDVLGRHGYAAAVSWRLTNPDLSEGLPSSRAPDWSASYVYGRWRPQLFLAASSAHDTVSVSGAAGEPSLTALSRTRELEAGALIAFPRVRVNQSVYVSAMADGQDVPLASRTLSWERRGVRAGWVLSSARLFGYSISPERGVRVSATLEEVLPALGADGRATTTTLDARAYLPAAPRHGVLALRFASGLSRGQAGMRRSFASGGPAAASASFSFARDGLGLLRGLDPTAIQGLATMGGSVDYRFPIVNVERGFRQWPGFLNQIHGALVADYVTTGRSLPHLVDRAWSAGGELSAQVTIGYGLRLTATAGAAWVSDSQRATKTGKAGFFARTGFAF